MEYVWFALLIAAMGGMWWFAYRMEPHWSSKDGRRFLCTAHDLSDPGHPGRKRETRISVTPDGILHASQKQGMRRQQSVWTLVGKSPTPPTRMEIYVARRRLDGEASSGMMSFRLPAKSRCVPVLDSILASTKPE